MKLHEGLQHVQEKSARFFCIKETFSSQLVCSN